MPTPMAEGFESRIDKGSVDKRRRSEGNFVLLMFTVVGLAVFLINLLFLHIRCIFESLDFVLCSLFI
jgi:hypothetical protein